MKTQIKKIIKWLKYYIFNFVVFYNSMGKTILFLLLLLINLISFSQEKDYLDYHKRVSKALMLMLDGDHQNSLKEYKLIAEDYDFIFPKDYYVAAQLAASIDSIIVSKYFLSRIITNGVYLNFLKRNKILNKKYSSQDWSDLGDVKSVKFDDYNLIEKIYNLDQPYKCKNDRWFTNRRFLLNKKLNQNYLEFNDSLVDELLDFTKRKGFPSYQIIGCNHQPIISGSKALIVLYHHPNAFSKFGDSLLLSEVKKGNLHLFDYALLHDFEARHYLVQPKLYENQIIKNYKFNVRWENTDPKKGAIPKDDVASNKERIKIGLMPIEYQRKMKVLNQLYRMNYSNKDYSGIDFLFFNF